jgi:hypothetical protein
MGVKWTEREANDSSPLNAEVLNEWVYHSTPLAGLNIAVWNDFNV